MSKLNLYSIFHLNLDYSSVPTEDRWNVIRKCYWPLMTHRLYYPIAIEASGHTLELINELEPDWLNELKAAIKTGHVEFIGSGYSQIIAPLVPYKVNEWNLMVGKEVYESFGLKPKIWYINEQAYSAGIVENYVNHEAEAIVMEWNNARTAHPEWKESIRYWPQRAKGHDCAIPVIWNDSILFQKFQRVAHGDITATAFIDYLKLSLGGGIRSLCIYGSDAEVFNYRPNRYKTEAKIDGDEWARIKNLYGQLKNDAAFNLIFPSDALKHTGAEILSLESPAHPIIVKKQPKYNVSRWAVTGKDNVRVNTRCFDMYGRSDNPKKMCYLWSSDFRSHITDDRWAEFEKELAYADRWPEEFMQENGEDFRIYTKSIALTLDKKKGLAIKRLNLTGKGAPQIGTIPHGYFKDDIALSPDWFSGNVTLQCPGKPQMTDLSKVHSVEVVMDTKEFVVINCGIQMEPGVVIKTYVVYKDIPRVEMRYSFPWATIPAGSFRLANITLMPLAFERSELMYATHNGGKYLETFPLSGQNINQGKPASSIVSASGGLGATEGVVILGDNKTKVKVWFDQGLCAAMPMLVYQETGDSFLARLIFSVGEMDESRPEVIKGPLQFMCTISEY